MRTRDAERLVAILNERKEKIINNIESLRKDRESQGDLGVGDEGDQAAINQDTQIDQALTAQQTKELNEIEYALSKVSNGTFGVCEMCGENIGLERMRVKPHAKFCIVCRETYEKQKPR